MEWVKTTAKTVPEAIELALDNLGVDESEAEIEVLEEPKSALFGLRTKGVARIRARVKPRSIRPKQHRDRKSSNKQKRGDGDGRKRNRRSNNRSDNNRSDNNRSDNNRSDNNRSENRSDNNRSEKKSDRPKSDGNRSKRSEGNSSPDKPRAKQAKNGGNRSSNESVSGAKAAATASAVAGNKSKPTNQKARAEKAKEEETPVDEVAEHLEEFLTGLTKAFGFDDGVVLDDSEDNTLVATVQGQHGLLVGPKGRTLDAIQELARISTQRAAPSSVRIKVDVGGYRAKRNEALADFARKAADKAVDGGTEVALEPMTPADRKVVHDALNDDRRVETRSVGNEPHRKVLVVPSGSGRRGDEEE